MKILKAAALAACLALLAVAHVQAGPPAWAHRSGLPQSAVGLNIFPFDITEGEPAVPPGLSAAPRTPGRPVYAIIKFSDRFNRDDRDRLSLAGVRFYGYLPVNAFMAKVPDGMMDTIAEDPAVEFVGDYLPAYRLDRVPLGWVKRAERGEKRLLVQVFDDEPLGPIIQEVERLGGKAEAFSDRPGLNGKSLKVSIDASKTAGLASIDGIQWVEQEPEFTFHNDVAAGITNVSAAWSIPASLKGTGQVVAVCDSGLDTGSTSTLHDDFSGTTSDGKPKLKQAMAYGRAGDWSDPHGHGTHTSGSVLGFGVKSNELVPGTFIRGMAYDAQLVFQSVLNSGGGLTIPNLNGTLFPNAYTVGARVHSNSWGDSANQTVYTSYSVHADTFTWNNKDFVLVFSAGNDGTDNSPKDGVTDAGSVSAPSTAKNVVTVGASENYRPSLTTTYFQAWPLDFTLSPIRNDRIANNSGGMVAFSGRGPCQDGRIKPDILAPGTFVLSTKSSIAPSGNYWTTASGIGYDAALDPYYASAGGTSMSAPLVSGSAALVRQRVIEDGLSSPSAALVKALLVAGAFDMTPGQYGSPDFDVTARPDVNQGWGRLDIKAALFPDPPAYVAYRDEQQGMDTGGSDTFEYTIADTSVPLRVNLVWTDYPGAANSLVNIVNDLDLAVTTPDGSVYHGNRYSGSASVADDPDFDRVNNVEGVTVPASSLTTGTLTVSVSAYNVPNGPQPYALAITGGLNGPPVIGSIAPASGLNNAGTQVSVTGSDFVDGCTLKLGTEPCSIAFTSTTSISATVPAGLSPGLYDVIVTNPDERSDTLSQGFTVEQDTEAPAAPQGLAASAGDGYVNVRWGPGPEPDLTGYNIYFNTYSTTVGPVYTYRLDGLTNGVSYDIYLKALDVVGNVSQASTTVSATPFARESRLPHYDWDLSPVWQCGSCHVEAAGGLLPQGFDFRYDQALCLSCHNAASVGHRSAVKSGRSHGVMSNVTAGGAVMPSFGSVTSGEYSDTMYTHLKGGDTIVCTTCHNAMRKPHDSGRAWELLFHQGGPDYASSRGGWWDQAHARVKAHHDEVLWTPAYSRDREALKVLDAEYTYDESAGTLSFANTTTGYVYLSLEEPYLRTPGPDNTLCLDCHQQASHKYYSCLACHEMHGETGLKLVGKSVRIPGGSSSPVVFTSMTGANSFADGDTVYDGICEVCHTNTAYYRNDGSGLDNHTSTGLDYSGTDCTVCHAHGGGFLP